MRDTFYELPPTLAEDIDRYEHDVRRFLAGELPEGIMKAKRVPRGVYEQRRNGSYMIRIRVAGGTLTSGQTGELARLASEYASGRLHVTTRQDVQLHDVSIEKTPEIMRRLMRVGLTSKGGGGNTVRNVTACPYAGICPFECFDVTPFAHRVTEYLIPLVGSYNLPRKYKIAFSGCAADCALAQVADLGFIAQVRDGEPEFRIVAGGGMGAHSRVADVLLDRAPASEVIRVAEATRRLFDELGDRANRRRARLRYVVERIGIDAFRAQFAARLDAVVKDGVPQYRGETIPNDGPRPDPLDVAWAPPTTEIVAGIRCFAQRQEGMLAVPVHLPLGFVAADDFARLGDAASRFSEERGLRTTRMQNLVVRFVRRAEVERLARELRGLTADLISRRPLERFVACAGASTCRPGLCLAREAARASAEKLKESRVDFETLDAMDIYINGCPNACGHQPVGAVGLFGAAQRVEGRLMPCYRVTLGGRCDAAGARLGAPVGQVPARIVPALLTDLAKDFQSGRREDERFASYFDRKGREHFEAIVGKHEYASTRAAGDELYRDVGVDEDFSLAGRGAGECGAGVFEVIQEDLAAARRAKQPFDALAPTARALLITQGVDTHDAAAVFREFEKHFVDTGLIDEEFRELLVRARGFTAGWKEALDGYEEAIDKLRESVELLYSTLDGDLKFHPPSQSSKNAVTTEGEEPVRAESEGHGTADRVTRELDLRGVACPMNFVKAKLQLETMNVGDTLAVVLDDGEPIRNVPASFRKEGQAIEEITELSDGRWRLIVRKVN